MSSVSRDGNRLELHQRATVSGSQSFDFRYGREKQDGASPDTVAKMTREKGTERRKGTKRGK